MWRQSNFYGTFVFVVATCQIHSFAAVAYMKKIWRLFDSEGLYCQWKVACSGLCLQYAFTKHFPMVEEQLSTDRYWHIHCGHIQAYSKCKDKKNQCGIKKVSGCSCWSQLSYFFLSALYYKWSWRGESSPTEIKEKGFRWCHVPIFTIVKHLKMCWWFI